MVIKESQLTKLRSTFDYREMEAKNLFSQELLGVTHRIALTPTSLYRAKKPAITDRLPTASNPIFSDTMCGATVIEMSTMITMKAKCNAETLYDFIMILYRYMMVQSKIFQTYR